MYGCNTIGVENDSGRASSAIVLKKGFEDLWETHKIRDGVTFPIGEVKLVCFDIRNPVHRELLVNADFILCNNFNEVWTTARGGENIDGAIGGLFALMKPGAIMATLTPLRSNLPIPPLSEVNQIRKERNLPVDENASFYEYDRFDIGTQSEVCSWSQGKHTSSLFCILIIALIFSWLIDGGNKNPVYVHKYIQTAQPAVSTNRQVPVFLCNNRVCSAAKDCIPIEAVVNDKSGVPLINEICPSCKQKAKVVNLRSTLQRVLRK
jgi:hypothetical protein